MSDELKIVRDWLLKLPDLDLEDIVADGGVTSGMVVQQEAALMASKLSAILARAQGSGPGEAVAWRPMTADMIHVGAALCAVRVYTCGKFQGWDIHYVVIDDETGEIAPDFEQGWALSDYEFWMPISPPAMIAATPTREA